MSGWEALGRWAVVIVVSVGLHLVLREVEIWVSPEWTVWLYRHALTGVFLYAIVRWVFR